MAYDLNLPKEYTVSLRNGASCTVDVTTLTTELVERLVIHGLHQKIADAAANAKALSEAEGETRTVEEIAADLMDKVRQNLEAGDWGRERGAATGDPLDAYRIAVIRDLMKTTPGIPIKRRYEEIPSDDQKARREFLLEVARKNAGNIDPEAERRMEADREAREMAKSISIEL